MAGLIPLPPTIHHTSQRLTHAEAQFQLSTFLEAAENDASYRPDSTLTERGPQSTSTGANPNLTLHHLKRILQGIEGKRIGGADITRFFGDGAVSAGVARAPRTLKPRSYQEQEQGQQYGQKQQTGNSAKRKYVDDQHPEDGDDAIGIATEEQDGWQDKGDYETAQQEGGMELLDDDRLPGMRLPQPRDEMEAEEMLEVEVAGRSSTKTKRGAGVDKKARKEAKKARRKDEQRIKNAKNAKSREDEE